MATTMELTQRRSSTPLLLFLTLILVIFAYIRWEDVVIEYPDGSVDLTDATKDKVADRVDRLRYKTEFYMLVAKSDGYYECPLCPPEATSNGRFFLSFNSVYKYGITTNQKGRYSKAELERWNLEYILVATGSETEMKVLETTYMGKYPLLPENLARPKHRRLVTPPGSGTRLR